MTQISRIAPWANLEVRASESTGECRSVGVRHGAVAYAGSLSVALGESQQHNNNLSGDRSFTIYRDDQDSRYDRVFGVLFFKEAWWPRH